MVKACLGGLFHRTFKCLYDGELWNLRTETAIVDELGTRPAGAKNGQDPLLVGS